MKHGLKHVFGEPQEHMAPSDARIAGYVEWGVRAVLIVDLVESVRLMEQDEEGAIYRWLSLVDHVETQVLPERRGHLVKSLGDGMLLEFGDVRSAAEAAFVIQRAITARNAGLQADQQMSLRMGIEVTRVIADAHDIYGRGVNRAARLMTLAGPGEIVISAQAREQLTPMLDAEVEDLGDCYVKHFKDPIRAYRIGPPAPASAIRRWRGLPRLLASIAVIPLTPRQQGQPDCLLGEVIAEELIRALSSCPDMDVISRLSTTALRGRVLNFEKLQHHLDVNYVLSGTYGTDERHVVLNVELSDVRSQCVVWADKLKGLWSDIVSDEQELIREVFTRVRNAVQSRELQKARASPLPTIESYTLLMSAINLMHRMSREEFFEARDLLQAVIDRAPLHPVPQSWMANWYVLSAQQGWTNDRTKDAQLALNCTKLALDADPDNSLALAVNALVHTHMSKKLDIARDRYAAAVRANASNSLAWLLKGTLHAFRNEGDEAVADTQRAISLSPLDPHRYYYDSLAGTAYLSARKYDLAIKQAKRSLSANRQHTSTLRVLAIAQWELGLREDARQAVAELMQLEPTLTIRGYLSRSPAAGYETGKVWSQALRGAGVPG